MRSETVVGVVSAAASTVAVDVPEPIAQAIVATVAAALGWLTTIGLGWLRKRLKLGG